jgi:hypothetical protein
LWEGGEYTSARRYPDQPRRSVSAGWLYIWSFDVPRDQNSGASGGDVGRKRAKIAQAGLSRLVRALLASNDAEGVSSRAIQRGRCMIQERRDQVSPYGEAR